MQFCPYCANLLLVDYTGESEDNDSGDVCYFYHCRTCPFRQMLTDNQARDVPLTPKARDDVMGGEEAWANVAQATVRCANNACENDKAYFLQMQIRSADEPMTTFYKCTACGQRWNE